MVAECARRMQMNPMIYERLVMIIRENLRPHLSMQTPATRQPTKLPMDSMPADKSDHELLRSSHLRCHSLIQLASWAVMTMCSPHTLHPSLLWPVMLRREGRAGPVNPITAPFSKQPRVAQNVAKI